MKRVIEGLSIVLFSTAIALAYNYFSPKGIALIGDWDTSKGVISAGGKNSSVVHEIEIDNVTAVKEAFDSRQVLFVDARPVDLFHEGHIEGAVSLPIASFDDLIEHFYEAYPFDTHIVTYCSGRECPDSHELAQFLIQIGYTHVQVFIDGYPAWVERGFPVELSSGSGMEGAHDASE